MSRLRTGVLAAALAAALLPGPACGSTTVGGFVVGTSGFYDYSPSVLQQGQVQDFYWCGDYPGHLTDAILHEQYSFTGGVHITETEAPVLQETPGAWDSLYTCNPAVVRGAFPGGYTWAMYYAGTSTPPGVDNAIGAAFSDDGLAWTKAGIVIPSATSGGTQYGTGDPQVSYVGGTLTMVYEVIAASGITHYLATSADGVTWTPGVLLSSAGLSAPVQQWGGAAYDAADGRWYVASHEPLRPATTTGGVTERGEPGTVLYASADPVGGPWTELDTIDTNLTGYESNFLAGLLRGPDGTLYAPALPSVELYLSTSNPRPAATATPAQRGTSGGFNAWDIAWSIWTPGSPMRALTRYYAPALGVHEVSTGWVDTGMFHAEAVLGHVAEAPAGAFTRALYGCVLGAGDYFVSPDPGCEGQLVLGLDGYLSPAAGAGLVELYRCRNGADHFVSTDPLCEGRTTEAALGWAAP